MRTYNKIVNAIDLLSASIIIFLLSFVWVKFYIRNLVTSLIIALIISISFTFITRKIYDKKNTYKQITIT